MLKSLSNWQLLCLSFLKFSVSQCNLSFIDEACEWRYLLAQNLCWTIKTIEPFCLRHYRVIVALGNLMFTTSYVPSNFVLGHIFVLEHQISAGNYHTIVPSTEGFYCLIIVQHKIWRSLIGRERSRDANSARFQGVLWAHSARSAAGWMSVSVNAEGKQPHFS